ncbi:phage tail protein [Rhodanobacter sp. Si-c]|uniref:Phage tail protein n=1 Tax=Rhodanobacter lycopersici TaxID=3162487 RepID=A0ABV3QHS1_9GAMM
MSDYFIGQIMLSGFNFAPRNFAMCNGQLLPINQYQAVFALLGTVYGGNGTTNFQLPDLRGRTPVGYGNTYPIGNSFGIENATLDGSQVPVHTHAINATTAAGAIRDPANSIYGTPANGQAYANAGDGMTQLHAQQMQNAGGSQPHSNLQPFNVLNFSMCLYGIFPTRG